MIFSGSGKLIGLSRENITSFPVETDELRPGNEILGELRYGAISLKLKSLNRSGKKKAFSAIRLNASGSI